MRDRETTAPIAACLFARVSDEVDARLAQEAGTALRLTMDEFNSGPIPWVLLTVGDENGVRRLLAKLQAASRAPVRLRARNEDGSSRVVHLSAAPPANAG